MREGWRDETARSIDLLSKYRKSGGEGGIRTHVPLRARRFRGAPVTTTSVPLRVTEPPKAAGTFDYSNIAPTSPAASDGKTYKLSDFRGKKAVVVLWRAGRTRFSQP
jgi:hypothetical protein